MYTFTILLTFADGRTKTVEFNHSIARYASLQAKQAAGAKTAKIISRKADAPDVTPGVLTWI